MVAANWYFYLAAVSHSRQHVPYYLFAVLLWFTIWTHAVLLWFTIWAHAGVSCDEMYDTLISNM